MGGLTALVSDKILALYAKEMSRRDIVDAFKEYMMQTSYNGASTYFHHQVFYNKKTNNPRLVFPIYEK